MPLIYALALLVVKEKFVERINKDKRIKLIILTKTPFKQVEKYIKGKKAWACVDLTQTGGSEKQSGVLKISNANDPTSLFLILEQFVQRIRPQAIYIESLEPILFGLNDMEKQRFLKMLNDYMSSNNVDLIVFDDKEG
ncbi:MAG: hypothetical protein QXP22_02870 [Candidatus Anstonellales archaeon]